jgi:hypothetical protein
MFVHVEEAKYLSDYKVWVRFKDGAVGEVDLADELWGPVFGPLRDLEQFKKLAVRYHTISWETGADFAPEFLRPKLSDSLRMRLFCMPKF